MFINHLGWQHHQEQQKRHQSVMEPTQNAHSHNNPQNPHQIPHFHHPWIQTHQFYPSAAMFSAPSLGFNLNHEDNNEEEAVENVQNLEISDQFPEKEAMFEKPLTPSDVGKLNRLVIPKQHAEKYFPLGGDSGDKGLLLSFEDEAGKPWRFRYSYWNSSQSYVLTKGWSRYVKEKRLDAGDVILFERHRTDGERFFIGWRRRASAGGGTNTQSQDCGAAATAAASGGGNDGWSRGFYETHPYLGHIQGQGAAATVPFPYQPDCLREAAAAVQSQSTAGNSKRQLRLFGVNLECELDESEPSTPDESSISSQGPTYQQFYNHSHPYSDITFSQDMRNRRG